MLAVRGSAASHWATAVLVTDNDSCEIKHVRCRSPGVAGEWRHGGVCPPAVDEAAAPVESWTREDGDGVQLGTTERMEMATPWMGS